MEDIRNFVVMYGKNGGTCNVHAAKVLQTSGGKVAVLPIMQIFKAQSQKGVDNQVCFKFGI